MDESSRVNLKTAFFSPCNKPKRYEDKCVEKERIMRTAFLVFYIDALRMSLKNYIHEFCKGCNQAIGGKAAPVDHPHTCIKYKSMRQAFDEYGACTSSEINQNNEERWKICRKWWDFIFDLPECSSITHKDAVKFAQKWENDYFTTLQYGWEEEFNEIMGQFYWFAPNQHIGDVLKQLSKM